MQGSTLGTKYMGLVHITLPMGIVMKVLGMKGRSKVLECTRSETSRVDAANGMQAISRTLFYHLLI